MGALEIIETRMSSGQPFTYGDLAALNRHSTKQEMDHDRLADRTIQKWRRKGLIAYRRIARKGTVWSLTDAGKAAVAQPEAGR